jgi:4-amino-4-deoxy-L-arabinose transferase-like glycosyltransferase
VPRPTPAAPIPLWAIYPILAAAVLLTHLTLLRLPYFWDEAGYYIPAAWDFFRTHTLIPQSTTSNAHPPLPSLLLAAWWHLFGFHILATRILVSLTAAAALTALYRTARALATTPIAIATTLLTSLYPIWFAQSTLAHADIFAATFTLWAISIYLAPTRHAPTLTATLFALAALSKETAILTPAALAAYELYLAIRNRPTRKQHLTWLAALTSPLLPLLAWYAYHYHRTGYIFGNPEFLRYNATANLTLYRVLLCLWHRIIHLTAHMNLYVATGCALPALLMPALAHRTRLPRPALTAIAIILLANLLEFSILGGALLTRYLLPMYPLVLLLCVVEFHRSIKHWYLLAALSAAGFLAGLWINPPYAFAPEDNLTYRDMIVLHQQAVALIAARYPAATVLTAWPGTQELERPELGYLLTPIKTTQIQNFAYDQIQQAAQDPGAYDTAFVFSTKWSPPPGRASLGRPDANDKKYFDFHDDLHPAEIARLLHGDIIWQSTRKGEWAAILRFPRSVNAQLTPIAPTNP